MKLLHEKKILLIYSIVVKFVIPYTCVIKYSTVSVQASSIICLSKDKILFKSAKILKPVISTFIQNQFSKFN